jgi:RHS repeat-associated protein
LGTRLVTNAQNTTYFEQQTLPFGTALNESPPAGGTIGSTNKRFTSYDRSANTGLDYAINRHYDPQQGRFTQVDPIGAGSASLDDPQSWNMYGYCANDPVNRIDPNGLFWGKLWRAIKSVVTSKWFVIALTVALAVITIGSAAFGWTLVKTVFTSLGSSGFGGEILIATGQAATTLGWVASGITAALAAGSISFSAKAILGNAIAFAAGIGVSQVLSRIPLGPVGPGGTPPFGFQDPQNPFGRPDEVYRKLAPGLMDYLARSKKARAEYNRCVNADPAAAEYRLKMNAAVVKHVVPVPGPLSLSRVGIRVAAGRALVSAANLSTLAGGAVIHVLIGSVMIDVDREILHKQLLAPVEARCSGQVQRSYGIKP